MKRGILILLLLIFGLQMAFAQAEADPEIPAVIRNNRFFLESLRLSNLARLAFVNGDYLASVQFSEEAVRQASLSDEYVQMRLRRWEVDQAIGAARIRLTFAETINARIRFPAEYGRARTAFNEAIAYRDAEQWDDAISAANRVLAVLAFIDPDTAPRPLPAQYTVRDWHTYRDALWNIAGRPWVFNDPWQWRRLFEANRDIMPERDNPDLIHPGMVLTIPSIRGEMRQGMWDADAVYPIFR